MESLSIFLEASMDTVENARSKLSRRKRFSVERISWSLN
jgi:hypothetical protein